MIQQKEGSPLRACLGPLPTWAPQTAGWTEQLWAVLATTQTEGKCDLVTDCAAVITAARNPVQLNEGELPTRESGPIVRQNRSQYAKQRPTGPRMRQKRRATYPTGSGTTRPTDTRNLRPQMHYPRSKTSRSTRMNASCRTNTYGMSRRQWPSGHRTRRPCYSVSKTCGQSARHRPRRPQPRKLRTTGNGAGGGLHLPCMRQEIHPRTGGDCPAGEREMPPG